MAGPLAAETHWAAWPPSFYGTAEVWIATSEPGGARVRVEGPGLSTTLEVRPGEPGRIPLPDEGRLLDPGLHPGAAWRLAAEVSFQAFLQVPATEGIADSTLWTSHDTALLPDVSRLGRRYRALAWPADGRCYGPAGGEPCADSWVLAVAVRSGTRLEVGASPCSPAQRIGPLAAGDAWLLRCTEAGQDLTGLEVRGSAPFLLLSGNRAARLPADGGSADNLVAAPLPEEAWGETHYAVPVPGDPFFADRGDHLRVVGDPATAIEVRDGLGSTPFSLPAGGVLDLDMVLWNGRPLRIDSDRPVAVAQLLASRDHRGTGDPALVALVPAAGGVPAAAVPVPDGYGEGHLIGLVAPLAASVRFDGGAPLDLDPLPGGSHGFAVIDMDQPGRGELGEHRLRSDAPFAAWAAGQGLYKSYAHPVGWSRPVGIHRGETPDTLEAVEPNASSPWIDPKPAAAPLLFYQADGAELLLVERRGGGPPRWLF